MRKSAPPERKLYQGTPRELVALIKGKELTRIAEKRVTDPYIGLWLEFQGRVIDVGPAYYKGAVQVEARADGLEPEDEPQIVSSFDEPWRERVENLQIRARVTVVGEIATIHSNTIWLEKCELKAKPHDQGLDEALTQ